MIEGIGISTPHFQGNLQQQIKHLKDVIYKSTGRNNMTAFASPLNKAAVIVTKIIPMFSYNHGSLFYPIECRTVYKIFDFTHT